MDVQMRGTIMPDEWADIMRHFGYTDVCCPADFRAAVESEEDIDVYVNSDGGSLIAGTEIYSILAEHKGKVTAHIQSRAASAATVAMMACAEVVAEPVSLICVHNPSTYAEGDSRTMRHTAEELENVKSSIILAYSGRLKKTEEEISELMDKDMWIDARTALSYGLIDKIAERGARPAVLVNGCGYMQFPTQEMEAEYRAHKAKEADEAGKARNMAIQAAKSRLAIYR